jgi:hypothetical protein
MDMIEISEEVVEVILTKLSKVPVVGDALEAMSIEDYDKLEEELCDLAFLKMSEKRD